MAGVGIVIGGDSRLGTALCDVLAAEGHLIIRTSRRRDQEQAVSKNESIAHLDMLEPELPLPLPATFDMPGQVTGYICAAITGIAQCERDPNAWRINADAPLELARELGQRSYHCVFVSSDAVETAPHTAYAMQKAYAELAVLTFGGCVIRPGRMATTADYRAVARLMVKAANQHSTDVIRWQSLSHPAPGSGQ